MESVFYGFETLKFKQMTNRDLAEKIYEDLNKRGAGLGNFSIGIIKKTLDDNGVKNCYIPDVVGRSEQLCQCERPTVQFYDPNCKTCDKKLRD